MDGKKVIILTTPSTKTTKSREEKKSRHWYDHRSCFIHVKYDTFKSFITQSLQIPISASKVDRKWQFPQWLLRPTKLPVSSYFIWFPTHLTPPLRSALSISDIKDLSETLSGLHNQSNNCMSAQPHADVIKLQWQSVTGTEHDNYSVTLSFFCICIYIWQWERIIEKIYR